MPPIGSLLLLSCLAAAVLSSPCSVHTDCNSCATARDGFVACQWCAGSATCSSPLEAAGKECPKEQAVTVQFDCPLPVPKGKQYNDTFTRTIVMPLIGATSAHSHADVQTCLDQVPGTRLVQVYEFVCDQYNSTCLGYLAVNEQHKSIVLAFRGSKFFMQVLDEVGEFLFGKMRPFPSGGNVLEYFSIAFDTVWDGGMSRDLRALIIQHPDYQAWVFGHSLGGAMASLASAWIGHAKWFPADSIKLITFGQPRTGDIEYAMGHDAVVGEHHRVVHHRDLVPHIPPRDWDAMGDSAFHHRYEVWYDNNMTPASATSYRVCTRADDHACSNTLDTLQLNPLEHLFYFDVFVGQWYKKGCKY